MMIALRNLWSDERGNSFIEMALFAQILAALLFGTVDLSRAYSAKLELEQAAQRVIERVQASEYKTSDNSTLQSEATSAAGTGASATATAWLECNNDGSHLDYDSGTCANSTDPYARYFQITVQKPFTPMFGGSIFPGAVNGVVTLRATAGVRTQ